MTTAAQVVEVQVLPRGSSLVADYTAGATSVTVANPVPFPPMGSVLLDGRTYAYTLTTTAGPNTPAGDPQTYGVLALSPALVADAPASLPVTLALGQALSDVVLLCATYDADADLIPVVVPSAERDRWTSYAGSLVQPIPGTLSADLTAFTADPGWSPAVDGSGIVDVPDAPAVAVTPPTQPVIRSILGTNRSLVVNLDPVPPSVLLDYLIDGVTVVANSRSSVESLDTNAAGQPMTDDPVTTTYTVTVHAHNAAGTADSLPATAQRDPGVDYELIADTVVADRIRTGGIQVGTTMSLSPDPDLGFTFTTDDGDIYIRRTGSQFLGALLGTAVSIGRSLTWVGGSVMRGAGIISQGIGTPPAPKVAHTWTASQTVSPWTPPAGTTVRGLADGGTQWVTILNSDSGSLVIGVDKTSGAPSTLASGSFGGDLRGVVRIGTSWYVLSQNSRVPYRSAVAVYDNSWNLTGTLILEPDADGSTSKAVPTSQALGTDGSSLYHLRRYTENGVTVTNVRRFDTAGAYQTVFTLSDAGRNVSDLEVTSADFGAARFVVSTESGGILVYSTTTGQRITTQEWAPADNVAARGLTWDGTRFHSIAQGSLYHYSQLTADTARSVRLTYYRPTPQAESVAGAATTFTQAKRWWMAAYTSQPDPPASTVRYYIGNQLQGTPTGPGLTSVFGLPGAGGAAPPTTSTFTGGDGLSGLVSAAVNSAGSTLTLLAGDGKFRALRYQQVTRLTFDTSVAANVNVSQTWTFSPPFDAAPKIALGAGVASSSADVRAYWSSVNASRVIVTVRRVDAGISASAPVYVDVTATCPATIDLDTTGTGGPVDPTPSESVGDNADGTATYTGSNLTDNGDGRTATYIGSRVTDNGDGKTATWT